MLLVTGMAGHSGMWFLERLRKEGYRGRIRCVALPGGEADRIDSRGLDIEKLEGDLRDEQFIRRIMQGVDTMVHIAHISLSPPLIREAVKAGVHWAILVHTTGRFSKYKSAAEEYIKIDDEVLGMRGRIDITILRPTMIYGSSRDKNMYKLVRYLHRHRIFPLFGNGKNLMQPVHARDLGNAYYQVLMNPQRTKNREYNLSGKAPLEYGALVRIVGTLLGRKNLIVRIPLAISIAAAGVYAALFRNPAISVEQVMRMNEDKDFAHDRAAEDFGYDPIGFEEGMGEEVEEYRRSLQVFLEIPRGGGLPVKDSGRCR